MIADLGDPETIRRVELYNDLMPGRFVHITVHPDEEKWITLYASQEIVRVKGYITVTVIDSHEIDPRQTATWHPTDKQVEAYTESWDDLAINLLPKIAAWERLGYQVAKVRRRMK